MNIWTVKALKRGQKHRLTFRLVICTAADNVIVADWTFQPIL